MAQENAPNKPVHLMFLGGGILFFYLIKWTIDWIWGYFARTPSNFLITATSLVIALGVGLVTYQNERVYTLANEVASELKKVAWPSPKEVKQATLVVIVMTLISASILGLFDFGWSWLTDRIYG